MDIREQKKAIKKRISELKSKLFRTDYKAIKFAEGELTAEEYADTREQRRAWRVEINELQAQILTIKDGYGTT